MNSAHAGPGEPDVYANRQKLRVLGTMLAMFFAGGLAGALGFKHVGYSATIPLAGLLVVLTGVPMLDDLREWAGRPSGGRAR